MSSPRDFLLLAVLAVASFVALEAWFGALGWFIDSSEPDAAPAAGEAITLPIVAPGIAPGGDHQPASDAAAVTATPAADSPSNAAPPAASPPDATLTVPPLAPEEWARLRERWRLAHERLPGAALAEDDRAAVARAVLAQGPRAAPYLLAWLGEANAPRFQLATLDLLRKVGGAAELPGLEALARREPSLWLGPVKDLLGEDTEEVVLAVLQTMASIAPREALPSFGALLVECHNPKIAKALLDLLRRARSPAALPALEVFLAREDDLGLTREALAALVAAAGREAGEHLEAYLDMQRDRDRQFLALVLLAEAAPGRAFPRLRQRLEQSPPEAPPPELLRLLGAAGGRAAVPVLEGVLQSSVATGSSRRAALAALADILGRELGPNLLPLARASSDPQLVAQILALLPDVQPAGWRDLAYQLAVEAPSALVRGAALMALARTPQPQLPKLLEQRLAADPDPNVRVAALQALALVGDAQQLPLCRATIAGAQPDVVRAAAVVTLARLGGRAEQPLLERLVREDRSAHVRNQASRVLLKWER